MKIKFRGKELDLHYSNRMFIIYENIMGKGASFEEQSYTAVITLLYGALIGTLKYNKMETDVTYDEFMNWLDEQPRNTLSKFSEWFVNEHLANNDLKDEVFEAEMKKEKKSKGMIKKQ